MLRQKDQFVQKISFYVSDMRYTALATIRPKDHPLTIVAAESLFTFTLLISSNFYAVIYQYKMLSADKANIKET